MVYLDAAEIDEYCQMIPVDESHIQFASTMIDAYVGTNNGKSKFSSNETTEVLKPNRKGVLILKNDPVIDILSIQAVSTRDINEN